MREPSPSDPIPEAVAGDHLRGIFERGQYLSIKHSTYFHAYETLFGALVGKPIVFVEIGILNGGSLFMWREYLGPQARIIGVDLNPQARQWEAHGFEIVIGDQSNPAFWRDFFAKVGPIDVLLDDGGHTNAQQIATLHGSAAHVRDGGWVVVEDTHCSYFPEFGNPSKYSFVTYAKRVVDDLHARHPGVRARRGELGRLVSSVLFFESIVAFRIDRRLCFVPEQVSNGGVSSAAKDFRYDRSRTAELVTRLDRAFGRLPLLWRLRPRLPVLLALRARVENRRLRTWFR